MDSLCHFDHARIADDFYPEVPELPNVGWMTIPLKLRLLFVGIVFANCVPWLVYRLYGTPYDWPSYRTNNDLFKPGSVSLRFSDFCGLPGYYEAFQVLGLAQLLLFVIWFAFGSKPITWRLTYLLSLAALMTRMHIDDPNVAAWFGAKQIILRFSIGYAFFGGICLLSFRLAGVKIRPHESPSNDSQTSASPNQHQFTWWQLLWWATGLAFFLALWKWIITIDETLAWIRTWPVECGHYLSAAMMTIGCLWLALGTRYHFIRVFVFCAGVIIASCWQYDFPGFRPHFDVSHIVQRLMFLVPVSLWIIATLGAFRVAGFRLKWCGRATL
ncbi:MAG: hypothetical protein KDA47_25085 [Planctomycetales bacterium]|nr:hypothetical protein [Planctomycetales bacterium]